MSIFLVTIFIFVHESITAPGTQYREIKKGQVLLPLSVSGSSIGVWCHYPLS
jgi:uncharacterized membrane protein YjfL (UPF0719 family)